MAEGLPEFRPLRVDITTPQETPEAAPQTTSVDLGLVELVAVRVLIPPGHAGLTGLAIRYASEPILPWGAPQRWLVGDGVDPRFDFGFVVTQPFDVLTWNTDEAFDHTHYLSFEVSDLRLGSAAGEGSGLTVALPRPA